MQRSLTVALMALLLSVITACRGEASGPTEGDHTNEDIVVGMDTRPTNDTCTALPRPSTTGGTLTTVSAFSGGSNFSSLLDLRRLPTAFPGWIGITQAGNVHILPDGSAGPAQTVLTSGDFTGFTNGGERGLLGLAVDPSYPSSAAPDLVRIFVNYTGACDCAGQCPGSTCSYVSRFDLTGSGVGASATFTAGAEHHLMRVRQPASNHNGGSLNFGPDGMLYIGFGDGGLGNDPWCNAQNLATPLGKMLRIDVHTSATGYTIPDDNPYRVDPAAPSTEYPLCDVHEATANPAPGYPSVGYLDLSRTEPCPEIIAFGLRNPYRFSFDRVTGEVWIGDVGQDTAEEIDRFAPLPTSPNFNFGWPLREGASANSSAPSGLCDDLASTDVGLHSTYIDPVYFARHSDNASRGIVTGGFVYRGVALGPDFYGSYFFSDAQSGEVWVMSAPYDVISPVDVDGLDVALGIAGYGFAEDDQGELVALTNTPVRITVSGGTPTGFPTLLSETGCVNPNDPRLPASGLIPYEINAPLWSDAATKERYIALPNGARITMAGNCGALDDAACVTQGDWDLPVGTVLVKMFRFGDTMLETRLLMRHSDGQWAGYTYVWDDAQSDGTLAEGSVYIASQDWTAPSRTQCLACHTAAAGRTLGLETAQLNRDFTYAGDRVANQLETLRHIDVLADPFSGRAAQLPSLPNPYSSSSGVDAAARAYLHANCSHCHRPGGPTPSSMDLRAATPFANMGVCDVDPLASWGPDVRLLAPTAPASSLLWLRPNAEDGTRMPPFGTEIPDGDGTAMLSQWITNVTACP